MGGGVSVPVPEGFAEVMNALNSFESTHSPFFVAQ